MKKVKFLLICLFISFLFTNALTAEVPETESKAKSLDEHTYAGLLTSYKETHSEIIAKLEHAKKNIPEIKRLLNEINSLDKLMAKNIKNPEQYNKYMEKYNKLNNSFFGKFGTVLRSIWLHFPKFSMEKEPQKLDEVIKVIISLYKDTLTCFDNNAYSGTINCESLKKLCVNYGSDDGNMYYYELTKDLELHKVDVSANYPSWFGQDNITDVVLKDNFYFCRILTMTASPFSPEKIAQNQAGFSFIENFYGSVLPYPEIFKKICINKKPSEQIVLRLFELQTQYPNESNLKRFSEQYEKWQSECGKATQKICAESYVIKDKVILAYETVGCTIREVTKEDVESDIRLMDSHADKLKHSTLLDSIDICQQANDEGFFWYYVKLELSKKCKEENKAKTKNRPVK